MTLSNCQITDFQNRGFLLFSNLLETDEVTVLQSTPPEIFARQGPEIVRESEYVDVARLAFGAHTYSKPFQRLIQLPRLLNPVRHLLDDEIYLHQSRINPKQGFGKGAAWDWRQDYPPWREIDGMPNPHCIMVTVFIDDCTVAKSPLLVIPGSHRHGLLDSEPHADTFGREYALRNVHRDDFEQLANNNGIEPLLGDARTVCFVHCNVLHGSASNVSPWRRAILYLIYNSVSNACTETEQEWYHNNRDFTPLQPISDNALLML